MSKYIFKISVCIVLFFAMHHSSFCNAAEIINYYYYKGEKQYLKTDKKSVFIILKNKISLDQLKSSLGQFHTYFVLNADKFDVNEEMQILELKNSVAEQNIIDICNALKTNPSFEFAAPVFFSPQGNENPNQKIASINEVIVQFRSGMAQTQINNFLNSKNLVIVQQYDLSGGNSYLIKVPLSENPMRIANDIFESGIVNYSEPNFFQTGGLQYAPNDELYPVQWALNNRGNNIPGGIQGIAGCDMRVETAWDITLGTNKVITSVVDSGIDTLHPDIKANMIPEKNYNFYNNNTNVFDDYNHGTSVSGIISGIGNNNTGISGIAPNGKLIAVRIFNQAGNSSTNTQLNGLIYTRTVGSWVCNNSWVGTQASSVDNAILDGVIMGRDGKGIVYNFATGNAGNFVIRWPASLDYVISVGAMSPCNQRKWSYLSCDGEEWWASQHGRGLDIMAPGVKIAAPTRRINATDPLYIDNFNGTSSATANISGVCALALSLDSTLRWDTLRAIMCRTADKVGAYVYDSLGPLGIGGWNMEMGYGKANAEKILRYILENKQPSIAHVKLPNTDNKTGPYAVNAQINSIFGNIDASGTKVFWTRASAFDSISMTNSGGQNWTANIPGNNATGTYKYYIRAKDVSGRIKYFPENAPAQYLQFLVTDDNTPPVITHSPLTNMSKGNFPPALNVYVADLLPLDSVWVRWYKNNIPVRHFKMQKLTEQDFTGVFNASMSEVYIGDSIFYKVFAQDASIAHRKDSTVLYKFKIVAAPLAEGFTPVTFPPLNWSFEFTGVNYWKRVSQSSYLVGTGSAKFEYLSATAGTIQTLTTLNFDATNFTDSLLFDYAHAYYNSISRDSLFIEASSNSGNDFMRIASLGSNSTPFASLSTVSMQTEFIPTQASQWGTKRYSLPVGTNKIRFVAKSGFGNNLYLDSIRLITTPTGITHGLELIPDKFDLKQNYPNPFNPVTKIDYDLPFDSKVSLKIYDLLGKEVLSLVNNDLQKAGYYSVQFNGLNLSSGIYFYRLVANNFTQTKKMLLVK